MKVIFLSLIFFWSVNSFGQNSVVTEFKDNHGAALSLYFYPSTLRMVNIERNKEFDEMIREVKKARFFKMDSGAVSTADVLRFAYALKREGFEEIMTIKNRDMDVRVWGVEKRNPEMVMLSRTGDDVMILELNGMINVAKIPKLTETFNQNAFLDVLKLRQRKN